jgi:hypothetical protein
MLNEKNIDGKINFLFEKHKDLVEVYKELKKEADGIKEYSNLKDELSAYFIYSLIKNKVDLEQFSNVMSYLYTNSKMSELGKSLMNFFVPDDPNISLRDFVKKDRYKNKETISDNMAYLFLDFKEENINGKKLTLEKDNLPYLLAILNEAKDDTIEALWYGGYHRFISHFRHDIEPIGPLIEMAEANPAFHKRVDGNYLNFFDTLLREIGNRSYDKEIYPNQNKETEKLLYKYIKNADNIIAHTLVREEGNEYDDEIDIKKDLGLLNFCLKVDKKNLVSIIDQRFKDIYTRTKANVKGNDFKQAMTLQKVLVNFSSAIDVSFSKYDFSLDCSPMDLNAEYQENFIYLKLIERKINNKQDISLDPKIANYIINLFNQPKKDPMAELLGMRSVLSEETILPYLKVYSNYQELEKNLDNKNTKKTKKNKV